MTIDLDAMIDKWRSDLMDLTRRNRLLHFSKPGNSYRRLASPDLYTAVDDLDADGIGWHLDFQESGDDEAEPGADLFGGPREQVSIRLETSRTPPPKGRRRGQGTIFLEDQSETTFRKFLTNLKRRADLELSERGVHVLYMTAGMLEWRETDDGDIQRSPLLLFPVVLVRDSINDPFILMPAGEEEISINPALQRKMENDFNLAIPELPSADEVDRAEGGDLCRGYFETIRDVIANRPDWRVTEEAWLGLFTFHKLVMYADLRDNRETVMNCPLVRALAGEHNAVDHSGSVPNEKQLDQIVDPADVYHVLDSDSSQFGCLEAVRRGASVVLQGPPGTGKSQTITNIVSQAIADGKSVLFVSEKMAALDVVHRRLEQTQLGPFCLELHSHKANKREVVHQLRDSMNLKLEPGTSLSPDELERLRERRDRLNGYVRQLHLQREPFRRSVHQILSELAMLHDAPFVPIPDSESMEALTPRSWIVIQDAVARITRRWPAVRAGEDFPWYGAKPVQWSSQVQAARERELDDLQSRLNATLSIATDLAGELGRDTPITLSGLAALIDRGRLLETSPGVHANYHSAPLEDVRRAFETARDLSRRMEQAAHVYTSVLQASMEDPHPGANELATALTELGEAMNHAGSPPEDWESLRSLPARLQSLVEAAERTLQAEEAFTAEWGLKETPATPGRLDVLGSLHGIAKDRSILDPAFLDPGKLVEAEDRLRARMSTWENARLLYNQLLEMAEPSILELDLPAMLEKMRTSYKGFLRILMPGYHTLKNSILGRLKGGLQGRSLEETINFACEVHHAMALVQGGMEEDRRLFGSFARGHETDIQQVRDALALARSLFSLLPDRPLPEKTKGLLCCGGLIPPDAARTGEALEQANSHFTDHFRKCGFNRNGSLKQGGAEIVNTPIRELLEYTNHLSTLASRLIDLLSPFEGAMENNNLAALAKAIEAREDWIQARDGMADIQKQGADYFGDHWQGTESNWERIGAAIEYLDTLLESPGGPATRKEIPLIARESPKIIPLAPSVQNLEALLKGIRAVMEHFDEANRTVNGGSPEMQPWDSLSTWINHLRQNTICLRDLADIAFAREEIREVCLLGTIDALMLPGYTEETFPRAVTRTLLQGWLDHVYSEEPILARFRQDEHQRLIDEFRELDRRILHLGPHRVIDIRGHEPPSGGAPGGEVAILRQEAAKKRRHMPLRKLFENLPTLIQRLKPCLLMSPLSVSQFLKDSSITFDLLVFDEASQIRTHDAIAAIMRAKQVVVCGDSKQLPPTDFFSGGLFEGSDEYDEDNDIPDYESVLDACLSTNMPETTLRWHYRSRHESLITYSNHGFYDYRLITFPNCIAECDTLGIRFEHVSDGIYDRGRSRTNKAEATRVVDLIVDIWKRHGTSRSIGVVAFNLQQANAILDMIELRTKEIPGLAELQDGERGGEALFVKNLENVQGDERDIILFSICYGQDRDGRMTNNFGPLNSNGGERRLNVAVTRAREQVIIVSSIRAADIDTSGTKRAGVLHLQKYLDYAERGERVLEMEARGAGEAESPLEESVIAFLREKGFTVDSQVGCSSFRIDIGVRHPSRPGSFVLGVECDGATYHSSATARDRDRLRQSILENNYGWHIHRIWGPEWVANRSREEKRLLHAIESAIAEHDKPEPPREQEQPTVEISIHQRSEEEIHEEVAALPRWATPFRAATPDVIQKYRKPANNWAGMLGALATAEEGIHLERAIQLLRDFGILERATSAIRTDIHRAAAWLTGDFDLVDDFLIPRDVLPAVRPNDEDSRPPRQLIHVPPAELSIAMQMLLADNGAMTPDALLTATARLYGASRLGNRILTHLSGVLEELSEGAGVRPVGDRIVLPES
ncbi:MAG: DUF4011 domain-containing protein [Candidatus Sumerlaeia bacterium]|nr:DUF4011 domain-containing protein [Candidatus Sumerlaeia bacterium]